MILDRLEHAKLYRPLAVDIARALDFLQQNNLRELADGRHVLDGDRLFAIVQRYQPKPAKEALWESHRKYIDVQYVVEGSEWIGYAPLRDTWPITQAYDALKDVGFFDAKGVLMEVPAGSFAIFMPQDVHAPGLTTESPDAVAPVCKVVVKCLIRE
jgi:YhcH/YjgK/YiaL family protein